MYFPVPRQLLAMTHGRAPFVNFPYVHRDASVSWGELLGSCCLGKDRVTTQLPHQVVGVS
jgi:hypothetical protein